MNLQQKGIGKALITGLLTGSLYQEQARPDSAFTILAVRPLQDEDGNYLNRVEVDMPSGTYTIAVIDQDMIEEEP